MTTFSLAVHALKNTARAHLGVALMALGLTAGTATAAPLDAYAEGVVDTSAAQAFAAFTTKAGLESWMVAKAEVDWRIGGLIRTRYKGDGDIGDEHTIDNQILSYDEPRMYSMRIAKPPKGFPFMGAFQSVWSVVYFEALGPQKTKISIRMLGFNESEESQKMRAFFVRGNQYTIDQLVAKTAPK